MKITNLLSSLNDEDLLLLYIGIIVCMVIGIFIVLQLSRKGVNRKKEVYTNISTTTITDSVITYEKPIPTNSAAPKPTHSRRVGLYSIVEPNKRPPGHYNESKLDLLVTNGLFTIGSNWFYDLVFAA